MLNTILTIVHLVIAVALIITVLFQQGKDAGLSGTIGGEGSESFFGKNKGATMNSILAKITAILAVLFIASSIALSLLA